MDIRQDIKESMAILEDMEKQVVWGLFLNWKEQKLIKNLNGTN
jgi:hypothetical protein